MANRSLAAAPYRTPPPPLPDRYALAWAKIRRARNVAAASVMGVLGCGALMGVAAELRSVLVSVLFEIGVGAFIVFGLTSGDDPRCPRCGARFFGARPAIFARRCPRCRMPEGGRGPCADRATCHPADFR